MNKLRVFQMITICKVEDKKTTSSLGPSTTWSIPRLMHILEVADRILLTLKFDIYQHEDLVVKKN